MTRYKRFRFARLGALLVLGLLLTGCSADKAPIEEQPTTDTVTPFEPEVSYETFPLPQPILDGETSVAEALFNRRSQRDFQDTELTQEQLAQLYGPLPVSLQKMVAGQRLRLVPCIP